MILLKNMKLLPIIAILAVVTSRGFANRLICYYTNWSRYGKDPFKIEDIDATLCTHIVYSFLGLDNDGSVKSVDPWNDFGDDWTEGGLKRFIKLRDQNPSVKLIIGVGGWNEGPTRFKSMVKIPEKRKTFLKSSLGFIRHYNLDGLEIDWIYQDSFGGTPADKAGLSQLVKEMKPEFKQNGYVLSIATSAHPRVFENSYDMPSLTKYVDLINIMSYDLHGSWDMKTGHVAPLHSMKGESPIDMELNVEAVINRYIKSGANPEKLNAGLVGYGRTFTLVNSNNHGLNAPSRGAGKEDPLPYKVFCVQDKSNIWKKYRNEEQCIPYAVSVDQWVGYEDIQSLREKVKFSKLRHLGGVTFWSIDLDDFKGLCGAHKYPLLKAVKEELNKSVISQ